MPISRKVEEWFILLPESEFHPRPLAAQCAGTRDLWKHPREVKPDENETKSDDAEVQATDPNRCGSDRDTDYRGNDSGSRKPQPHGKAPTPQIRRRLSPHQHCRVGANAAKERVAQRNLATQTHQNVQAECSDREAECPIDEAQPHVVT